MSITYIFSIFIKLIHTNVISNAKIAELFKETWFDKFGAPLEIVSGNGTQYTNLPFRQLYARFGVRQHFCSPFNLTANGIRELLNQIIWTRLRINRGRNLDTLVAIAERSINIVQNRTLRESHEEIFFNRSSCDPLKRRLSIESSVIRDRVKMETEKRVKSRK